MRGQQRTEKRGSATDEQRPENRQSHSIGLKLKAIDHNAFPQLGKREKERVKRGEKHSVCCCQ